MPPKTRAPRRKGLRRTERREFVLGDLKTFRYRHWLRHYSRCSWGPESLIPDKTAAFLATNGGLHTMEDLRLHLPDWGFRETLGELVLARMEDADDRWYVSEGKINPNKIQKVVETKREAADRYNANKREKRRKLREDEEQNKQESLAVRLFVPGTRQFAALPSQTPLVQVPLLSSSQPQLPTPVPAQTPLNSSKTLNWQLPLSGLKPKVVRKPRAPRKPKENSKKSNGVKPTVASSSRVQIDEHDDMPAIEVSQLTPSANEAVPEDAPSNAVQDAVRPRPRPRPRPRTEITFDYHMRL